LNVKSFLTNAQPAATPETQPAAPVVNPTQTSLPGEQPFEQATLQATPTVGAAAAHQPGADAGQTGQGGGPPWAQEQAQPSALDVLDWRVLALITVGLSVAFTLIVIGLSSLKRARQVPIST